MDKQAVKRGHILAVEGRPCMGMYFILEGQVLLQVALPAYSMPLQLRAPGWCRLEWRSCLQQGLLGANCSNGLATAHQYLSACSSMCISGPTGHMGRCWCIVMAAPVEHATGPAFPVPSVQLCMNRHVIMGKQL